MGVRGACVCVCVVCVCGGGGGGGGELGEPVCVCVCSVCVCVCVGGGVFVINLNRYSKFSPYQWLKSQVTPTLSPAPIKAAPKRWPTVEVTKNVKCIR